MVKKVYRLRHCGLLWDLKERLDPEMNITSRRADLTTGSSFLSSMEVTPNGK